MWYHFLFVPLLTLGVINAGLSCNHHWRLDRENCELIMANPKGTGPFGARLYADREVAMCSTRWQPAFCAELISHQLGTLVAWGERHLWPLIVIGGSLIVSWGLRGRTSLRLEFPATIAVRHQHTAHLPPRRLAGRLTAPPRVRRLRRPAGPGPAR